MTGLGIMRRAAVIGLLAAPALADPAPGTNLDAPMHQWFERQYSLRGAWCCNLSDGHLLDDTEWRSTAGNFEVLISGHWWPVEADKLRDPNGGPNPTGKAIVWYTTGESGLNIYCFAPGTLY